MKQASILDLLRMSNNKFRANMIKDNIRAPSRPPLADRAGKLVTPPTISPDIANWLQLHGFDFEPMRVTFRGAYVWYWRVTRHNDPRRPKRAQDIPLHYRIDEAITVMQRVWPE